LFIASQKYHNNIVQDLCDNGANIDPDKNSGITPLFIASENCHTDIVQVICVKGANFNPAINDVQIIRMVFRGTIIGYYIIISIINGRH
jgi:ankyrin repeat protein